MALGNQRLSCSIVVELDYSDLKLFRIDKTNINYAIKYKYSLNINPKSFFRIWDQEYLDGRYCQEFAHIKENDLQTLFLQE